MTNGKKKIKVLTVRILFAFDGAFVAYTLAWILFAALTPGDYFSNGNPYVVDTLAGALLAGGVIGYFGCKSSVARVIFVVLTSIFIAFWVFVPGGWWSTPPHR